MSDSADERGYPGVPWGCRTMRQRMKSWILAKALVDTLVLCAVLAGFARAELPPDSGPPVATLAVPASKHWVWVNDFVFPHMADGMAYLIDGDSGRYLGTLSTGYSFAHVLLSRDG